MSFNIGKALGTATNLVGSLSGGGGAGGVGQLLGGGSGGGIGEVFADTKEGAKSGTGGLLGGLLGGAMETIAGFGQFGLGGMINSGLDTLGLPDWLGDIAGGIADFATGNFIGAAANGLDALGDGVKALGKLSDKIGQSDVDGYMEAGGNVKGMYDQASSLSREAIETANDGAESAAETIDRTREAARDFVADDVVSAGKKALDNAAEAIGHDAHVLGESGAEFAAAATDELESIASSFDLLEGADSVAEGLERIREEVGDGAAELAEQFIDDARAGMDFADAAARMYDRVADELTGELGESSRAVVEEAFDSYTELARAVASDGGEAIEEFRGLFESASASTTAGQLKTESGSEFRM